MVLVLLSQRLIDNVVMELTFEKLLMSYNPAGFGDTHNPDINGILNERSRYRTRKTDIMFAGVTARPKILAEKKGRSDADIILDVDFIVPKINPDNLSHAALIVNVHACNRIYSFRKILPLRLKKCFVTDSTPILVPDEYLGFSYGFPIPYLAFQTISDHLYIYYINVRLSDELYCLLAEHKPDCNLNPGLEQTMTIFEKSNLPNELGGWDRLAVCKTCGVRPPFITNIRDKGGCKIFCGRCGKEMARCNMCDQHHTAQNEAIAQ